MEQDIEGMDRNQSCESWQGVLCHEVIIKKVINSVKSSMLTFLGSRPNTLISLDRSAEMRHRDIIL